LRLKHQLGEVENTASSILHSEPYYHSSEVLKIRQEMEGKVEGGGVIGGGMRSEGRMMS
jgi:hypothetical protein